jgi:hypothetical protein
MVVSKAAKGQRRRRRRELRELKIQESLGVQRKRSNVRKKAPKTVVVISDSEDDEIKCLDGNNQIEDEIECLDPGPHSPKINDDIELLDSDPQVIHRETPDLRGDDPDLNPSQCDVPSNISVDNNLDTSQCDTSGKKTSQILRSNTPSDVEDNTFDLYDLEIEKRNDANDLIQYMQASINNDTSDEESGTEDDPLQAMWSIFYGPCVSVEPNSQKRILKSGKTSYEHPVASKNPSSQKLVPRALPRQTKHDRKNKRLAALGPNNNIMAKFLAQKSSTQQNSESTIEQQNSDAMIDPSLNHANPCNPEVPDEAAQRLNDIQAQYLSAPKPLNSQSEVEKAQSKANKAKAQWDQLHLAIAAATAVLKEKEKKNKKFVFPQSTVDNLNEFNALRLQHTLDGTPQPSSVASLATAQSSIRRQKTNNPPQKTCGVYLAKLISKQAQHVITYREIPLKTGGNKKNHKSLLNRPDLREALFKWAASQVPGAVSCPAAFSHVQHI